MKRKNKGALAIAICIAVALPLSGCASGMDQVEVKTTAAKVKSIETVLEVSGTLLPAESVNISSKISGKVSAADFNVGDEVKAGQILIKLDTAEAEAQLSAARASAGSAADQAKQAKIPMDNAAQELSRMQTLFAEGAVSQQQLDTAQNAYDSAKAKYDAAKGSGASQAQASLESAEAQLANATMTSPIDGVVITKSIHTGELASPGVSLVSVADISSLKLKGTISQELFPYLTVGQKVEITADAFPGKTYEGNISLLGPVSVGAGSYFPIELTAANPGEITAGLSAHSAIPIKSAEGVTVPRTAIVKDGGESAVYVIKDNTAYRRSVKTGLENAEEAIVTEGLKQGEIVAITNAGVLSDAMSVKVLGE